jgi:mono/diheme cytochrome c family protein
MKHTASKVMGILLFMGVCAVLTNAYALAAEDGAALYKKKCAGCHGAQGEGKPAMKAPSLKGTKIDADQITERLAKGSSAMKAPHNKGISGLTAEQAKAIADYVKTL